MKKKVLGYGLLAVFFVAFIALCFKSAPITSPAESLWALLPPIIAIVLALITKEVYSSLFIGILTGGILYAIEDGFSLIKVFNNILKGVTDADGNQNGGLITSLSDSGNVGILIFLVVLGIIVVLMNKAGGSYAYGKWAANRIKGKKGAQLSTFVLGCLIFVDDYFNCLTVGSVMRPVTDKFKISRAKLAYIIDATAAPVCIIAPISSWAAAVSNTIENTNGIALFIQTIPYNLYALLTIAMVIYISYTNFDYGSMKIHESNAENGDLFSSSDRDDEIEEVNNVKGKVIDLILPVIILIALCIAGMVYTGGFFSGVDFITAFADCDACYGLAIGSLCSLIVIVAYMVCRRVLSFRECMDSIPEGFKQMVPAILILAFAWTLNSMTSLLGADIYVSALVENATGLINLLPAILFVVALGLAFSTGTSWGTFGILIPIVTSVFSSEIANVTNGASIPAIVIICISACLAGAVCGDHCSPISDTTIMASAGAKCNHVNHVSTQLPYAMTVAAVSFVGYIIAGFVRNVWIVLPLSLVMMIATLAVIKSITNKKA